MDTRLIETKLIDVPKTNAELQSTFNKEFAVHLAATIKTEGMFNPIVVRPNEATLGRFILVQGRHRLYATSKLLKQTVIRATVIVDMDDTDAEMAMIAENLWRNPLSKTQHMKALRKWSEHYASKHPDRVGSGASGGRATSEKRKAQQAAVTAGDSQSEQSPEAKAEPAPEPTSFDQLVATSTGKSLATAKRDIRIARAFTADQLEALEQMSCTQADMTRLAKIKDEQKRGEIVSLIASGMDVDDAIREGLGEAEQAQEPTTVESAEKKAEEASKAAPEPAEDETPEQWFKTYYKAKAALLKDPAKFKADALLYHLLSDLRTSFRGKAKKHLAAAKKGGAVGPFYALVNRFVSLSHPKDWLLCDECAGTGEKAGSKCGKCHGSGVLLRTEQYI